MMLPASPQADCRGAKPVAAPQLKRDLSFFAQLVNFVRILKNERVGRVDNFVRKSSGPQRQHAAEPWRECCITATPREMRHIFIGLPLALRAKFVTSPPVGQRRHLCA
jgi:hypothetical protein